MRRNFSLQFFLRFLETILGKRSFLETILELTLILNQQKYKVLFLINEAIGINLFGFTSLPNPCSSLLLCVFSRRLDLDRHQHTAIHRRQFLSAAHAHQNERAAARFGYGRRSVLTAFSVKFLSQFDEKIGVLQIGYAFS